MPVAVFVRLGGGQRVPFPLVPTVERRTSYRRDTRNRANPATVVTWGPLRVVLVWRRP